MATWTNRSASLLRCIVNKGYGITGVVRASFAWYDGSRLGYDLAVAPTMRIECDLADSSTYSNTIILSICWISRACELAKLSFCCVIVMAEPFGIAAGAVGIAAAFTACVDCFEYVQFGRHFGRDYQTDLLALNCSRIRLTRWGQAVDILNDPKMGRSDATTPEIQTVKETLYQILVLFADSFVALISLDMFGWSSRKNRS